METVTFKADAVFIPYEVNAKEGRDFDRDDCVLLAYEGENYQGRAYTEDESVSYSREEGKWPALEEGRLEWLPDIWIVKIPERQWWAEPIQSQTKRLFGVYALDRRQHYHLCSFEACYELHFIESQYEETDEVDDNDHLWEEIMEGDAQTDPVHYFAKREIDSILQRACKDGFLPDSDEGAGYKWETLAVTFEGALEEVWESRCNGGP